MDAQTTRRGLLAGVTVLAAVAPIAVVPQPSLAQTWAKAEAKRDHIDAATYPADCEERFNADCDAFRAMERTVLTGPIRSLADAAAKLRCASLSLQEGAYADRSDYAALEQVARWAETRL